MGNYKFRLSDMMPNAWFYKLRDMSKKRTTNTKPKISHKIVQTPQINTTKKTKNKNNTFPKNCSSSSLSSQSTTVSSKPNNNQFPCQRSPRKSYYFTRELTNSNNSPPRNKNFSDSPKKRRSVSKQPQKPQTVHDSVWISPPEYSSSSSRSDEILAGNAIAENGESSDDVDSFSRLTLAPIATKVKKKERKGIIVNDLARKSSAANSTIISNIGSPGIRLRISNSPRIADRRVSGLSRKSVSSSSEKKSKLKKKTTTSLSESFAVVKSSFDPQRDFRESMVEMIVENNIRSSKELEDLLACYLSLNSDEYHGLIIKVFKQIWFDITNISN